MKFQIFNGLLVLFLMFGAGSCKKDNNGDESLKADTIKDLSYGIHSKNTLDVYLPEGRTDTTKVIILLHGGWWVGGDKNELQDNAKYFQDKGFAVVSMNYRLAGTSENIHPAQQLDIAAAINYISSKAFEWKVSPDKFALVGVSAGAHLALLYTYANNVNNKIKTVISISGPTNFTEEMDMSKPAVVQAVAALKVFLGESFQDNPQLYVQASPIARASSLSKPTLILHGLHDQIVPVKQASDLSAKLNLLNVKYQINTYPVGHEIFNQSNAKEIRDVIELWLKKNIQ
jgi:acetyl esterase/lipase